ncbi:MAG: Nif3-like dinuclear metal center hexameric protein [Bacteroidales bacterium]|nr:Nif3-like dinuclear metal center hexameric protein [Bacteroidales bacterium]
MKTTIKEIIDCLEEVAPLDWQEDYDNAGLIVGNPLAECKGVLVCLDVFSSTVEEAIKKGCNLIVSHHPFIFHSLKKFPYERETTKILSLAMKNDISIYATHTNMDSSFEGVNFVLAKVLGLQNLTRLQTSSNEDKNYLGCGAIGELEKKTKAKEFLLQVKEKLSLKSIRYSGDIEKEIQKIGICGGSGTSFMQDAIENHCDCYLTGDIKYHDFLNSESRIIAADIGHYESEQFIKQRIIEIISKKISNFANLFISEQENRVKFL